MNEYWKYRQKIDNVECYEHLWDIQGMYRTDSNLSEEEVSFLDKLSEVVVFELKGIL